MAEALLFNIAGIVIRKLSSQVIQEIWLPWGVKDELQKLKYTVSRIQCQLLDAEEKSSHNHQIKDWLRRLKVAIYDAEELLDDLSTEAMWRQLLIGDHVGKKVRLFFSHSNQLAYGFKMACKIKHIRYRLDKKIIGFHLMEPTAQTPPIPTVQTPPMARAREQTVSSFPEREQTVSSFPEPGHVPNRSQEAIGKEIGKKSMGELSKLDVEEKNVIPTLKLSYDYLPSHLKNCFAYCRLFPKGYEFDVEMLTHLWMAQGYIKSSNPSQCLEDIGLEYFMALLQGSFFQEVKTDALGNIKSCKMNNLLHDLATSVAGLGSKSINSNATARLKDKRINSNAIDVDEKTYHMSFGFHLDSTWQAPVGLRRAKQLRTFLLPSQDWLSTEAGRWKMPNFEAILSNLRHVRVFDINNSGIEVVPTSIDKLKYLRYLDVSKNDQIKALPNSITKLKNLQVLKLSDCEELKELPKDIKKLVNLRHLDCERCWNLRHMPHGLGQLTSLQMLTWFVVSEDSSVSNHIGGLNELNELHNLRGRIEIRNLMYVKNGVSEFEAANLRQKPRLQSLSLCWNRDDDDSVDVDYDEQSLQSLQPHQNLKKLKVCEYGGVKFPSWLSSLTNLVDIWLQDCGRCEYLPQLDQIPSLKCLGIHGFPNLEYIDHEGDHFLNGGGRKEESTFFSSLKELYLFDCPNLKGWWKKRDDLTTLPHFKRDDFTTLPRFTSLSKLEIRDCPKLNCMPLFPKLNEKLSLENASLAPLQQTISVTVEVPSSSSSSSMLGQHPLKVLWIVSIEDLEALPTKLLQKLTSLQELHLKDCPRLASLTLEMHDHISLRELDIQNCAQLKEKCGTSKCPDWHKVSHIPNIRIDGQKIQWEGNYLLDHTVTARPLSKLRTITVEDLESLPEEWLLNLTGLQELHIVHCSKLMSLPRGMQHLTSLQLLDISQCPRLKERCGNIKGLDWCNISHIPNIQIDGRKIQWQGRYHADIT